MTSFIAARGCGRSTSVIRAAPAAWSVTTIAFIRDISPCVESVALPRERQLAPSLAMASWQHSSAFGIVRGVIDDGRAYELLRFRTRDGDETTVYLVRHPVARTRVTVTCFTSPERLDHWCVATGHAEAMVAGVFVRDPYRPLGEVRIAGAPLPHEPVAAPRRTKRRRVHVSGNVRLAPPEELDAQATSEPVQV